MAKIIHLIWPNDERGRTRAVNDLVSEVNQQAE